VSRRSPVDTCYAGRTPQQVRSMTAPARHWLKLLSCRLGWVIRCQAVITRKKTLSWLSM